MGIRLIAGRAGSGKTEYCLAQICRQLESNLIEGPRLILLVPEQAGLQMERGLLARTAAGALGRCEVLSFRRMAARIFNESTGPMPIPLTPTGRQMALRYLLEKNHRRLREFGRVAERSGFVAQMARSVAELLQEAVTVEQLESCRQDADDTGDPVASRLHDVALIYRAYLDYLGDHHVDPEGVLDLARSRMDAVAWLSGSHIWMDGFAGLTQQQIRMIAALGRTAAHIDIALLIDPQRDEDPTPVESSDRLSLFARTEQTWRQLRRTLLQDGVPIEEPILLSPRPGCPRFARSERLARLEQNLFTTPSVAADKISHSKHKPPTTNSRVDRDAAQPTASHSDKSVRLVTAQDRRTEVEAAVRAIVDLVQRPDDPMRYRDIAIVVRDLTPYHDLISASLRSCGIPFFIDRRRPIYHHPLIQFVRACVSLIGHGSFGEAMSLFLKSDLSGLSDEAADAVENHCLAYGLFTPQAWDTPWRLPIERDNKEPSPPPKTPPQADITVELSRKQVRSRLGDWWPAKTQRSHPKCRRWVERLYTLMQRFSIRDQLAKWSEAAETRGDLDQAAEHQQVWSEWIKLLDEIVAALGDVQLSGVRFRQIVESGLSEFTLGLVPATLDQILVSSIERSRHPSIRAMFVLGFSDGQFPARPADDSIFSDAERAFLQERHASLGRTQKQQLLDERLLAYVAVTRPSEFLWVSHPQMDEEGQPLGPSPYWVSLRTASGDVPVETTSAQSAESICTAASLASGLAANLRDWAYDRLSIEQAAPWLALYGWARETNDDTVRWIVGHSLTALAPPSPATLTGEAVAALWPPPYHTSVTRLETFAQCPFRHYAAYGLKLQERPQHELSAISWGRFYHTVLEQFVNEIMESGIDLRDMSISDIAGRLTQLCEHVLPEYAEELNLADNQKKAIRWRSRHELPVAVRGQQATIGQTPLRPDTTEKIFGDRENDAMPALELITPSGKKTVLVRGKIDRVDLIQTGQGPLAVVFDYKRSLHSRLKLDEVYHGLALQLLAYLLVLRDHYKRDDSVKVIPGGAFYLPLLGPFVRVDHPEEASKEGFSPLNDFRPRGVVDFDWIDQLDPTMGNGKSTAFLARRKKDGTISDINRSDAVDAGGMATLLDHVRKKMCKLADDWIGGEIRVQPARLGKDLPCTHCAYRSVCRFEYHPQNTRMLASMKRSEVLVRLSEPAEEGIAHD